MKTKVLVESNSPPALRMFCMSLHNCEGPCRNAEIPIELHLYCGYVLFSEVA